MVNRKSEFVNPKSVYFIGIGGIGMSALARYFISQGAAVSGYDKTPTVLTRQLISEGMHIHFDEDVGLLPSDPELVIFTSAVPEDHKELQYFRKHGTPLKKRAEALGLIARHHKTIAVGGTHGKTTTSTMIAHMLRTAGVETMAFLGGISTNYGTNFLKGSVSDEAAGLQGTNEGSFCVVEADEYDKSFLQLEPYIAIITAADADHLDIYGSDGEMKKTYADFTAKIVSGGSLIMKTGTMITPLNTDNYSLYQYALSPDAAFYAKNIHIVDGLFHFDFVNPDGIVNGLVLGIPGRFNLENAIAALSVGYLLGLDFQLVKNSLLTYRGVQRRFEFRIRRADLVYIDDYAHHPEELRACISAVRELYPEKKITGVFQPHLFSRTRDLVDDFARSLELLDELLLLDIYPAREKPIPGVTSKLLFDRVNLHSKLMVRKEDLLREIRDCQCEVLITMGAGDIDLFVEPITDLFSESNV
ncbi:MAG: UDP-N-acetylmuramate--L-alanine ligase [Bacteroidales bacterium]|nr:UDP-N-acetylmuramate--L-alanine ligase [Bacteroidales bacterium]